MGTATEAHRVTRSFKRRWPLAVIVSGVVATLTWDALIAYLIVVLVRRLV